MMSATTSATTGRRYGLERVCRMWDRSRSALYARRARARRLERGARPARRGPTPALSDAQLLAAIRSDLARSPFQGEGHRKVHARLRILDGVRVARTRVLRVMRAQGLLSPHRGRQGDPKAHDGTIVTSAPCVMWGTDGVRVFTAQDGWVWTFAAVDHWNAECVGWHVCKVGSRFAALEPVAQGLGRLYGSVAADVARGLALRMDHGSQYLSDHFLNQLRYWGIHPSFGFLTEPETNGVVERSNRTLKEQAIYGRVFENLADVRAAVDGRLLRQLDGRELLRHARVRVARPHDVLDVRRGAGGRVRFHRRVVQHAAAAFGTGLSVAVGVRTTPCRPCGRCPACGHPSGAHESVGSRAARGFHTAHREGSPYACHAVKPESVNLSTKSGQPQP